MSTNLNQAPRTSPSASPHTSSYQRFSTYLLPLIVLITGCYIFLPDQMRDFTLNWIAFEGKGAYHDIILARQNFLETAFLILGLVIGWHVFSLAKSMRTWQTGSITHLTDIRPLRDGFSSILMMVMITYYVVNQMLPAISALPNSEWSAYDFADKWLDNSHVTYIKSTLLVYCVATLFLHDSLDGDGLAEPAYKIGFIIRNLSLIAMANLCQVPMFITYLLFANLIVTAFACHHWRFAEKVIYRDELAFLIRYWLSGAFLTPFVWIFCSIALPTNGRDVTLYPAPGMPAFLFLIAFGGFRLWITGMTTENTHKTNNTD